MEIIIDYTKNIDTDILDKVSEISPWKGLKQQLLLDSIIDEWLGFVKNNISSILLDEQGEIISYGSFGIDNTFGKHIIENCGFNIDNTFLGIYLFTNKKYRGQGYAEKLKEEQIKYIKDNFHNIDYLLGETKSKEILKLYKNYGAIQIKGKDKCKYQKIFSYYYKIKD